jgi:low temperature requirement protein LtrA
MIRVFRTRPVPTEESHRVTPFEIFFDLVFVFAFIRIVSFMAISPTPLILAQVLVLLLLFWWSFVGYAWLCNHVRADVGVVRTGLLIVMAAVFVIVLSIPSTWRHGTQPVTVPLIVVSAYLVIRMTFLALTLYICGSNRLGIQLLASLLPAALSGTSLIFGVVLGGTAQTVLWAIAFLIVDGLGGRVVVALGGIQGLRSPSHFAERYGLVLIIALGESVVAAGVGAASKVTRGPVMTSALLGLVITVCLWWLYFENAASPAGKALEKLGTRHARAVGDVYAFIHFLLIAGVIYLALGVERVIAHVAEADPEHPLGSTLRWTEATSLFGGVIFYLIGRMLFLRFTIRHTSPAQIVAAVAILLCLPIARILPALATLGLIALLVIGLVTYERVTWQATAAVR